MRWTIEVGDQVLPASRISMPMVLSIIGNRGSRGLWSVANDVHDSSYVDCPRSLSEKAALLARKTRGILSSSGRKNVGGSRETPCQTSHAHAVERAPSSSLSACPFSSLLFAFPFFPAVQSPGEIGVFPCSDQGRAKGGE